jgi:hypothetical protein
MIKRLLPTPNADRFHLMANGEGSLLDQQVSWAARVLTMRPK